MLRRGSLRSWESGSLLGDGDFSCVCVCVCVGLKEHWTLGYQIIHQDRDSRAEVYFVFELLVRYWYLPICWFVIHLTVHNALCLNVCNNKNSYLLYNRDSRVVLW
jgi:hypothetical protein